MIYFEIDDFDMLRQALHEFEKRFTEENLSKDAIFTGKLVADELLSNVLQHGGGRAYFTAEKVGTELMITVKSEVAFRPPEKSCLSGPLEESGRGLFIVDALCARREYSERDGIKVYIELGQNNL